MEVIPTLAIYPDWWKRFHKRISIRKNTDCWIWQGSLSDGYGNFTINHIQYPAHRVSYTLFIGEIPTGLTLDHLCRNRRCVNPAHMECVTNKVNALRGTSPPAQNARKTHCSKGHEFTPENTYLYKSVRVCIACKKAKYTFHETRGD